MRITQFFHIAALAAVSLLTANVVSAAPIVIDGNYDAAYGAAKSHVNYDMNAPTSNFGTPTNASNTAAYDIYLTSDAQKVYGLLRADRVTGLPFANLYFDLDPQNNNGSDLGFEITNDRAFVPGRAGYSAPLGLSFATSSDGRGIEFAIPNALFTSAIAGLNYYQGQVFPHNGDKITLRLSQSFGFSVAGGTSYGTDRLGSVTLAPVPEPASVAAFAGVLGLGFAARSLRRRQLAA